MTSKTIDFAPYQTRQLADQDTAIIRALAEAGYQLARARMTNEKSGFYWKAKLAILRSDAA